MAEKFLLYVIVVILLALLVSSVWNLGILRVLRSKIDAEPKKLSDERYYELKYRMQFLTAVFTMIAALIALYGYDTFQTATEEIQKSLESKVQASIAVIEQKEAAIQEMEKTIRRLEGSTSDIQQALPTSLRQAEQFNKQLVTQRDHLGDLSIRIDELNGKNILQQNFYIIRSLSHSIALADTLYRRTQRFFPYHFENLRTNLGDKLPLFREPPVIITSSECSIELFVTNVTEESFEIGYGTIHSFSPVPDSIKFSLIIIEK